MNQKKPISTLLSMLLATGALSSLADDNNAINKRLVRPSMAVPNNIMQPMQPGQIQAVPLPNNAGSGQPLNAQPLSPMDSSATKTIQAPTNVPPLGNSSNPGLQPLQSANGQSIAPLVRPLGTPAPMPAIGSSNNLPPMSQPISPSGIGSALTPVQPAGNANGLPMQTPIGINQKSGNVLPLTNAKQLQSYANLPDSQLVQLPMSERNLVVTLGEVRKKFADDGVKSTAGGGSDIKFSNKRNTPNVSAVDSMFAAARAAASAAQAMTLSKAIKINGQTSPSVWLLAWNKPYYIESSDFKGPTSVKLQFSKQGKTFDLPITPGSSKAGGVAFSIPSSVVGVYQQPARVIVNDSDGATYTSADSTFYPHIITKSFKDIQVEITGNRFTPITSLGEIKVDSNGFSFKSQQRSDSPSNTGKAAFFNVEIKNFSPYWNIDDFGSGVIQYGPESVCDSFFAQQSNSGPNNVYFYNDWGGFDPSSYNSGQASQGRLIAVAPVIHCRSKYYTRANEHLFMGKSVIHLEISGPEGIPYNAGAGSSSPD